MARRYFKPYLLLFGSLFGAVSLRLAINLRDDQLILLPLMQVLTRKTLQIRQNIQGVSVWYLLSSTRLHCNGQRGSLTKGSAVYKAQNERGPCNVLIVCLTLRSSYERIQGSSTVPPRRLTPRPYRQLVKICLFHPSMCLLASSGKSQGATVAKHGYNQCNLCFCLQKKQW